MATNDGNFAALAESDQTAASRADGWTPAKVSTGQSELDVGVKQISSTFTAVLKPTSLLTGTTANAFKSPVPLTGTFAAGNWNFSLAMRPTVASTHSLSVNIRVFKSVNASGASAVELTSAVVSGGVSAALSSTTTDAVATCQWAAPAVTLNNEYLFIVVAVAIAAAGGSNSADAVLRTGQSAGGTRMVTTDFVASLPVVPTSNITNTQSVSGTVTEPIKPIVPATASFTASASGKVSATRAIKPTGVTNTNSVSGGVRRLAAVKPTSITNTQNASAGVRRLAAIRPTSITNNQSVSGSVLGKWTPAQIAGLGLWLDASQLALTDGADVTVWPDLSGLGNDVSCRVGTDNPPAFKTNAANGLPVIRFVSANSEFLFRSTSIGVVGHMVVVAKYNATTFGNYDGLVGDTSILWLVGDAGTNRWYPVGGATYYFNGSDSTSTRVGPMAALAVVGMSIATPATFTPVVGVDRFNAGRYWDGDIAEVVVYDHALSTTDRQQVENYLRDKWIGSPPAVISPAGITNTQSASGGVVVRRAIISAGITNSQSVSGAVKRLRPVTPSGITNTNSVSGAIRALRRIAPAGITNSQNVAGAVRRLAAVRPSTNITNTQSVSGVISRRRPIAPTAITFTTAVSGSVTKGARPPVIISTVSGTFTTSVSGSVATRPIVIISSATATFTNGVSGTVTRLRKLVPTTVITFTNSASASLRRLRPITPVQVTNTQQVVTSGIKVVRGIRPATVITNVQAVSGRVVVTRVFYATIANIQTVSGVVSVIYFLKVATTIRTGSITQGSAGRASKLGSGDGHKELGGRGRAGKAHPTTGGTHRGYPSIV